MDALDREDIVTEAINEKLQQFIKLNKIVSYQVINVETTAVPGDGFSRGYNLVSLHLAYEF
ncbi:MAG: hypothetical protein EOO96_23830 [Pedobacter sp.]|nr:MAG: hypothetical protein EOO96_23830 [Pedobacter sp.]